MRILFVAMPESVHATRWINQLTEQGWDLYLYSSTIGAPHPDFKNITICGASFFRPKGLDRSVRYRSVRLTGLSPSRIGDEGLNSLVASSSLARVVRWLKPDIVHSMEIQRAGYLTLGARAKLKGRFPPWIVGNWGSDICLYGRLPEHAEKIKAVLAACEYYHCECRRDVELGRAFGFKGEVLPVLPVGGGFKIEQMQCLREPGPTSARRLISLKGYQNWAGRALIGLRAIELCADAIKAKGYRVALYLTYPDVKLAAELLSQATGIQIEIVDGSREEILRMHGRSRISIGLSISDAISTSLLEAMVMGSFPVQSNTGCGNEWLKDGETGIFVPPDDPEIIAAAICRCINDDELVDRAAEENMRVITDRLDYSIIQPQVIEMYKTIVGRTRADGTQTK